MQNEYNVTWERYRSWTLERMFTGKGLILRLMWFLVCGWAFGMTVVNNFNLIPLLFTAVCVYFAFFRDLRRAKKLHGDMEDDYGTEWLRRITLEDEQIRVVDGMSSRIYPYSDIMNACERKDHFLLEMKGKTCIQLYKDGCIDCTADECWDLIEAKMDEYKMR